MGVRDILFLPVFILLVLLLLTIIKPAITDKNTQRYFFPAVGLKLFGALMLGVIYQFYYGGGDTFNYFEEATIIYDSFFDSPGTYFKLLFADGEHDPALVQYTGKMLWYDSPREYMVIRFSAFFALFCGNSYLVISFMFALISFFGLWAFYRALYDMYPRFHRFIAISIFFIPSLFFWGSGLMKDTLCFGALGWLFHGFYYGVVKRKKIFRSIILIIVFSWLILSIKPYIFYAFAPAAGYWVFNQNIDFIRSKILRVFILLILSGVTVFIVITSMNLEEIAQTSKIQSEYIQRVSLRQGGSAYDIGRQDGTFAGMLRLFLPAVNVSLFRPYIFEVRNPVMLLSALESSFFLLFTIYVIFKVGFVKFFRMIVRNPLINFCVVFALVFAFFVGVSSYNFGALVRYKIPLMPFYLIAIYLIYKKSTEVKKIKSRPVKRRVVH